jgi:hypothetical protein
VSTTAAVNSSPEADLDKGILPAKVYEMYMKTQLL